MPNAIATVAHKAENVFGWLLGGGCQGGKSIIIII